MFDFVRKHMKVMQLMLFVLIVPSFVLFGVEGYTKYNERSEAVARVDGRDITKLEWDQAHKNEMDKLRQSMPSLDSKLADSPQARYATLERLVRDRVLAAAAGRDKLIASDVRLARELRQNEVIASLRGPDGRMDAARYRQLVGAQGMTPEMFEERIRADLSARQVLAGTAGTGFATATPVNVAVDALLERREVQVARFDTADYAGKVSPTDAELEAFYKSNPQLFQAPEQANIEFVVLSVDSIKKGLTATEAELKAYYDQNAARLASQEERRASHILLAAPKSAPQAERDKARARAQELLAQVKKAPESFAELARKNSQDPGSAPNGGDLDFFTRGAMTKAFEDAAFALKKGEVSDIVETEFGYHIIRLTDVKVPQQRSFEQMRPELEADVLKQQAQRKFAENAEAFSNSVYEQADGLKGVAERFGLELRTAQNVQRTPAPGATGPLSNAKFLTALFSAESVEKKRNTEAVEVAPSQLVAGRVTQYSPARTLPLAEVKDKVRERVVAQRAAELARAAGAEKLAAWKANPASANLPAPVAVSREEGQNLSREAIESILRVKAASLPAFVGVDLGERGYVVAKVNKVLPREAGTEETTRQERMQYAQWWNAAEGLAYYNLLQQRFKVQIKVPKPEGRLGEDARR